MEKLTLEQVRDSLRWLEANYQTMVANGELSMAAMLRDRIDSYAVELQGRVQRECAR